MWPESTRADPGPHPATVLIELGTDRGEPDGYLLPMRRTIPDWFAPLFVALLVTLCCAGSAAPPPAAMSVLLSVPIRISDPYAFTDDGLLLVHTPTVQQLSGYDLDTGRLRWQAMAGMPAYQVRSGAGLVLLRTRTTSGPDIGTVALSAATGQPKWRVAGSILTVAGASTVLAVSEVRSIAGDGRRVEGPISGLDPDTGRMRWTVPVESTAVLLALPAPPDPGRLSVTSSAGVGARAGTASAATPGALPGGPPTGAGTAVPRLLVVHASGLAESLDIDTGRRFATVRFPAADYGPGDPGVIGGRLLLRHPNGIGSQVTAYDPVTLRRQWSHTLEAASDMIACGGLACLVGPAGVLALDPVDGAERWHRPGWRTVEQVGEVLLAYGSLSGRSDLVGIVDAGTGRVAVPLDSWRPMVGTGGGDHLLVTRSDTADGRTLVAVAAPGVAWPRPLGELPAGVGDCRAVRQRLACRSADGRLIVWAYSWG